MKRTSVPANARKAAQPSAPKCWNVVTRSAMPCCFSPNIISNHPGKQKPQENAGNSKRGDTERIKRDLSPMVGKPALNHNAHKPQGVPQSAPRAQKHESQQSPPRPAMAILN